MKSAVRLWSGMYNPEMRKDCPMRGNLGNCSPVGGFCMDAVSDEICEAVHNAYDQGFHNAVRALKEQNTEATWIYGESETGVDGWYCSECNFFEPWFYDFTDDIDFIRFYGHCPSCGRRMTSYTGKMTQEGR